MRFTLGGNGKSIVVVIMVGSERRLRPAMGWTTSASLVGSDLIDQHYALAIERHPAMRQSPAARRLDDGDYVGQPWHPAAAEQEDEPHMVIAGERRDAITAERLKHVPSERMGAM
jgi:hypothetical protein